MGNDIGIAENAKLGGRNAVEKGDLSLVGGSKQSDGDEILEEDMDVQSPTIGSKNNTSAKGESIAFVSSLNSNEGNSDVSNDVSELGVTRAPAAGLNADVDVVKIELPMGEENHKEKLLSAEEMEKIETNRLMDDGTEENNKDDGRVLVDSDATASETENLSNGQKMLEKSDQKPKDGILSNASDLEAWACRDAADGKEEQILQTQGILEPCESVGTGTGLCKLELEKHEVNEIQDGNNVEGADTKLEMERVEVTEIQDVNYAKEAKTLSNTLDGSVDCVSSVAYLNHEDGKSAEQDILKENNYEVPLEVEGADVVRVSGTNLVPEFDSNGDALHQNEQYATLSSGHQLDKHDNISTNLLHSELEEDHSVEQVEKPCASSDILKDAKSTELKELDLECVQIEKVDSEDADKEVCDCIPNADNLLYSETKEVQIGEQLEESCISGDILEVDTDIGLKKLDAECVEVEILDSKDAVKEKCGGIPFADASSAADLTEDNSEFVANLHSVLDVRTLNLDTAVEPCSSSSEILAEGSGPCQLQPVNSNVDASTTIAKKREQEVVKNDHKEIHLPEIEEHKVRSVSGISSSLDESSELAPAHPSSLDHTAKKLGPISQDTAANSEQEIKHTAEISSANSPSPDPIGLRHSVQLPDPDSKKKEEGSKSAADIPLNNETSAASAHPAGLGRAPLLESTSRVVQVPRVNGAVSTSQSQLVEDPTNGEAEEYDETREKLQMIRVKFLRLAHRLGQTPHNVVVAQVLYRLGLAEQLHGRSGGRVAAFSFDRASALAEQLEAAGQEPLDFTCTIMVLGKSGVGKSATINSIFDEVMFDTDAFQAGTKKVQDVVGTVQGIRVRVIDTPGLLPSWSDQRHNEKILHSVKKFIKKTPPDIILYLDRLDMQSRDFGDMPLLQTITGIFGPSIWFNAIVVLTHAASAPPEGPNGTTTSYDMFVTQRSQAVQQAIRQAAGDMRLMNPVSLVENHSACRTNRAGQRVLPNGQIWKPHLLLLSFASKILAEANTLLKLQDTPSGRPFTSRTRSPPLPFLLSSLLQSRPQVKLPSEQFGDDDDDAIDDDLDECSDLEDESEYDELPPFKSLTKAQLEKLSKEQRKAYYDELEYREKLFMKKQLKEERKRRKMMKKLREEAKALPADYGDNDEEETSAAASVPVPMPDLVLPASFDSDNPTHRYRSLDSSNPWLVRAVLEPNGWDHDIGYDGINVERLFVMKDKVPVSLSGHISKDKKDANLQMEVASSVKHGNGKATSLGFDMQSVGKDYAYTLRSETRFSDRRINKAAAGISATVLGDVLTGGIKVEDKLMIGKRGQLVVSGGAICGRGEVAYGGSLEATLRDKDHPFGRFLSTLGLSVMDWHGDLALGCNAQTQIPIGRHTNFIGRLNINNRGSGQLSVRINSSEQLQIVLVGLIPLVKKILSYSEQVQH